MQLGDPGDGDCCSLTHECMCLPSMRGCSGRCPRPLLLLLLLTVLLLMVARTSVSACRRAVSKPQKRSTLSTCVAEGGPEGSGGGGHRTHVCTTNARMPCDESEAGKLRGAAALRWTRAMVRCLPGPHWPPLAIAHLACPVAGRHGGAQVGELVHLLALGDVGRHDLVVRAHVLQQIGLVQHVLAGLGLVKGQDLGLHGVAEPKRTEACWTGGKGSQQRLGSGGSTHSLIAALEVCRGGRMCARARKLASCARGGARVILLVPGIASDDRLPPHGRRALHGPRWSQRLAGIVSRAACGPRGLSGTCRVWTAWVGGWVGAVGGFSAGALRGWPTCVSLFEYSESTYALSLKDGWFCGVYSFSESSSTRNLGV